MAGEVKMLMKDEVGWKFRGKLSTAIGFERFTFQQVLAGEFLVPINGKKDQKAPKGSSHPPNYQLKRDSNIILYRNPLDVVPLVDDREIQLLEGICSLTARHALFVNTDKFNWAVGLIVGKEVSVNILSPHLPASSRGVGVVRYIGPVTSLPGWQLGVEIVDNNRGCGTTDGTFRNQRYFECGHNNGIFVSLDKVSPLSRNDPQQPALSPAGDKPPVPNVPSFGAFRFKTNDRVMVFDKRGKEVFGRVRWWGDSCKSKHFGFMAVGIETEVKVSSKEFEGNVDSANPLKGVKSSHWLVMPATMVNPAAKTTPVKKTFQAETKRCHSPSMPLPGSHAYEPIPDDFTTTSQKPVREQRSATVDDELVQNNAYVHYPSEPISSHTSPTPTLQDSTAQSANHQQLPYNDRYEGYVNIEFPLPVPIPDQGSHNPYNLGIDSRVQTRRAGPNEPPCYGVIKWIGYISGETDLVAGVELDIYSNGCADGIYEPSGKMFFSCAHGHGLYTPLGNLSPDPRFPHDSPHPPAPAVNDNPLQVPMEEQEDQTIVDATQQMFQYLGNGRGIQGHQNSCYLDSTVFGLFALSDVFDTMFLEPSDQSLTSDLYRRRVAELLWKGIVNPLRKNGVVRYESVMRLRTALDELGKMEGITEKEKDPEEFLNMLFKLVLHTEPFFSIRRPFGVEQEFFVQLFVEHDPNLRLPTVGDLLRRMFREQQISFTKVPSKLLVQVPRFGREYKTYKRLVPELKLKIGDLAYPSSKACTICGEKATVVCESCESDRQQSTIYCQSCSDLFHKNTSHKKRAEHKLSPMQNEDALGDPDLLSVICIETSHYVCFTRDPRDDGEKRWIFFDSMADRQYDKYNIPRVTDCTRELNEWIYQGDRERLFSAQSWELPELVRRFTQDVYMCVYVQPDVALYGDGKDENDHGIIPVEDVQSKDDIIDTFAQENSYLRDEKTSLLQKIKSEMSQKKKLAQDLKEQEKTMYQQLANKDELVMQLTQQFEHQKQQLEDQKQQLENRNQELVDRNQQAEITKQELETQLAQAHALQQKLEAVHFLNDSWNVQRQEVALQTDKLGFGAWGVVFKGSFRKRQVAVKCAHEEILHQNTIDQLKREIRIMSHVQHPNLVRLLAAVVDEGVERKIDSPLLILERMDTDLRSAYMKKILKFTKDALMSIFRDIAYALHYLHEHQEPIIHRDVSAPNVLLQKIAPGVWKAKLSDFGSANLARYCKTPARGAIVYAAPETFPPSDPDSKAPPQKQTIKIDVFSYGYLLVEAFCKKMPSPDNRSTMLEYIKRDWRQLYDIVIACIDSKPDNRLTMTQVLEKLNMLS